jgi:glycosyltransferase involved in cell wall biosynthesis
MEENKGPVEVRIQGLKIVSCIFDGSGYGQGIRNWLRGLRAAGVPMWIQPVSFEKDRPELGEEALILESMCKNPVPHDINFVRLSPEVANNFLDPTAINICSCAWETSKIDKHWVECCNKFDAVFVESFWLVNVFKESGVTVPVYCVPNTVDVSLFKTKENVNLEKTYNFYSIQQWTERKNAMALLKAYFNAFSSKDNVRLVIKTYITRVEQSKEQGQRIKADIENLKKMMNLDKEYPPIYLITEKLSTEAIRTMHEECDCYVLLDRGEGLGLPYMDAAAAGNPILATGFGGSRQFLNSDNSYEVQWQPAYVFNMGWSPYYRGDQIWAEPNQVHATELMRRVYENREEAFEKGKKARETMETQYNSTVITQRLLSTIADVVATKRHLK